MVIGAIFYGTSACAPVYACSPRLFRCRSRNRHSSLLPMHGGVAESPRSRKERDEVGTRGPHDCNVLVRDDLHRDDPQHPIHFLHRQPGIPWCRGSTTSRTSRIPILHLLQGNQCGSQRLVSLEQLAGRWAFGEFCVYVNRTSIRRGHPQLYRCYIIYSMNYWVIAFPCLMYLASIGVCLRPPLPYGGALG